MTGKLECCTTGLIMVMLHILKMLTGTSLPDT